MGVFIKSLLPLQGIISVLNTPFTNKNSIDFSALKCNVNRAILAGVKGFLVPAMASEVYKLSISEKLQMVDTVLEATDNRVPVFAGTGESHYDRSLELLRCYLNLGCENILFQIPFLDEEEFKRRFMEMAELGPKIIMLQDWDPTGYGLPDSLIKSLFEDVESFRCLKIETNFSGVKYSRIQEITNNQLHISGGWGVIHMLEGLERGVHAFMPTGMHFIYTQIFSDYISGNIKEAENLFEKILPVIVFSNQNIDFSIQFFKSLLFRQGIYENSHVRKPNYNFDTIQNSIAEKYISRIIALENDIIHSRGIS